MPERSAGALIAIEEASTTPIRPEYVEGMAILPPQPDYKHSKAMALVIPDFYVLRREPTELDESYRKTHKGWYPIDTIALVGEVTSTNHETDTGPKLYVLINRETKTAHCHTTPVLPGDDPTKAYYDTESKVDLGEPLPLPAPYPALDTAPFLDM